MTVELAPITGADVAAVADFLHTNLNARIPPSVWARQMSMPWKADAPNHGFMLQEGQRVVGAYLALYSERMIGGRVERFCNLASWCVLPDFRFHSVRLLKALLAQGGYHFTDLTPSGSVVPLNTRLKFRALDTSAALVPNLPWPTLPHRTRISADPDVITSTLTGAELELYRDHAQAEAARHVVLIRGSDSCYVMFRQVWVRTRPTGTRRAAGILHVSNPELFRRAIGPLTRHLLVRHRFLLTLAELRIVGQRPPLSRILSPPAGPKMYRSASLEPVQIDDLYSELVCIPT
jgi:hypothetical protein